ncbi:MAG: glycerol-3-phosphate responsive antiterminator [Acidipropionibacterium sp.]|jgi:glycerol uptake operon antiterminator|nr:glycerol-3-phosphate responsive antiterminator [Acidipropionibacterium sp.]
MTSIRWRVIPSVRDLRHLDDALSSSAADVLLSNVHIGNLAALSARIHDDGKRVLVQSDLVGGFRSDTEGLRLLRHEFKIDGIFTSSHQTVALAKRTGMRRYFRVTLMDSRSVCTALDALKKFSGDGVELLPAPVALEVVDEFRSVLGDKEILAGGFIRTQDRLESVRAAGFDGATTSNRSMWSET